MALVINNNMTSLNTYKQLRINTKNLIKTQEKLSSGMQINQASDNASGLSISEGLRTKIRGNKQAINNAQDGINALQIAEGGLDNINSNLQRIRELTIQAANDTNATNERTAIAQEVYARFQQIDTIARGLRFNRINLLDGSASEFTLQVGADANWNQNALNVANVLQSATSSALNLNIASVTADVAGGYYADGSSARTFLGLIDNAINTLSTKRNLIGAYQNRIQSTLESIQSALINISATESQIRDTDIAKETAKLVKEQVLQQSATSLLAQSNQQPTLALSLL